MNRSAVCLSLALLFIAFAPSYAQTEAATESGAASGTAGGGEPAVADDAALVVFEVRGNLSLRCMLPAEGGAPYVWTKNGSDVAALADLRDRHELLESGAVWKLRGRALEADAGNYTCAAGGERQEWRVLARPVVKLDENANVVEQQNIKIQCRVIGKPDSIRWSYRAARADNATDALVALGARGELGPNEAGAPNASLTIRSAQRSDAGWYGCHAESARLPAAAAATQLRVKDMYAALWPFLGICAEVLVLCAIILVYEKRRTKPELDDSDTDNHDQKKS